MRVALVTPRYWPEVRRGGERFVHDLAVALPAHGLEPVVLTNHRGAPGRSREDGVEVRRAWRPPDGRLAQRMWDPLLASAPGVALGLERLKPDLVHMVYPTDALAVVPWARRRGVPVVLTWLGLPHRAWVTARRGRATATRRALAGARAVVALSAAAAVGFERWLAFPGARVIPPGVDLGAFSPGAGRAASPTVFCAADAREPRKRVGLLLDGFTALRARRPDLRLELSRPPGGSEPGLPEGASWVDVDDREALVAAYRRAWVTALPSTGEAFGLVLAESLACGTPGVAAREGGMPEVLGSESRAGCLFDAATPAAVADAVDTALALVADPATPSACRRRAEHFGVAEVAARYAALYESLTA